ncbi:MAG: 2OG-Fe(II) oxygenase family protein [Parvibaculum sp.]|nr:2OG-Fe(II) oxygenase family protein [Parvibaculum sp.]
MGDLDRRIELGIAICRNQHIAHDLAIIDDRDIFRVIGVDRRSVGRRDDTVLRVGDRAVIVDRDVVHIVDFDAGFDDRDRAVIHDVRRIIGNAVAGCATQLAFDFDHFELFFQEMWLNKNGPGDFNKAHVHPNSLLSGAYYAKVPEGSGNIEFYDPVRERVMCTFPVKERTRINSQAMEYKGKEGLLLIFPGWLQHSVQPNRSEDFRVSISFNMGFRRKGG